MPSKHGAIVVFGSGPGLGRHIPALFAERGFETVVLTSRNVARLQQEADWVQAAAPNTKVEIVPIDLADTHNVQSALREVERRLNGVSLECVLFNAARVDHSPILTFPAEELESDLRISVISMYKVAQWTMPHLLKCKDSHRPAFLVTSGTLYKDPYPEFFSLSACKAAQYNMVHSLHKEFRPRGIHCGIVVVGGEIDDKSVVTNARNIAEETWKFYTQPPKGEGDLDVVVVDPAHLEHVRQYLESLKQREQAA